jgi:hypothetical protein
MRARAFGLGTVCGLLVAAVAAFAINIHQRVSLGPDTQSAFLKNYNPRSLIERFACGNIVPSSFGPSHGASAGVGFVSHQSSFTAFIEIDEAHWVPLTQALAADVNKQLLLRGGERNGAGKDATSLFYYQDGRSIGSVSIPPLVPYDWITNNFDRHAGCTPVLVNVYIDEVFVPKLPLDPADQAARISNRVDRNQHEQ